MTQKLHYREPIVFNAREKQTGARAGSRASEVALGVSGFVSLAHVLACHPRSITTAPRHHPTPRTGTIIMLHGLGDSGDGWAPVGAEWAPGLKHVKFIFPHAPNVSSSTTT